MKTIFRRNISGSGRLLRGLASVITAGTAWWIYPYSRAGAGALILLAAFLAFEAARGWCAARACGIKTPF